MQATSLQRTIPAAIRHIAAAVLFGGLLLGGAASPLGASVPAASFEDVVDVRVINLEAVVEARGGDRVEGLKAGDFRITIDDRELIPEYFSEVDADGDDGGVSYLIFVDDYFALPSRRDVALNRLRADLASWRPTDRMALVAYDGRHLETLVPWTSSAAALRSGLDTARKRPAYGLQRRSEVSRAASFYRTESRATTGSFTGIGFVGSSRSRGDLSAVHELVARVERVGGAAAAAARQFADVPGRKVLILLSGGWPGDRQSLYGLANARDAVTGSVAPGLDGRQLFGPLVQVANRYGFTVYPIDLGPGSGSTLAGADFAGFRASSAARDAGVELSQINQEIFSTIAAATGGKSLLGGGADALPRIAEDVTRYYSLGIRAAWQADDREHSIRVEVRRPGVKVRARESYFDATAATQRDWRVASAFLFDRPFDPTPGMAISTQPADGGDGRGLNLALALDPGLLTWKGSSSEGGRSARVEVRVAGSEDAGLGLLAPRATVDLQEPAAGSPVVYETRLQLRRRSQEMLVTVYEVGTGRLLARKLEVAATP
jgi:VWFA-related protein